MPYLTDFCWAFLPVLLLLLRGAYIGFFAALKKDETLLFLSIAGSLLAPFMLFCFQDWGRWIHFMAVHTFIFLAVLNNLGLVTYNSIPVPAKDSVKIFAVFFDFLLAIVENATPEIEEVCQGDRRFLEPILMISS